MMFNLELFVELRVRESCVVVENIILGSLWLLAQSLIARFGVEPNCMGLVEFLEA